MADLTTGTIPIATGTHQIDDGPLSEDGAGGVVLLAPTGATTETYLQVSNGSSTVVLGAIDASHTYVVAFGAALNLSSDTAITVSTLQAFADDAAAAAGGVPVQGLYRTASVVKVRVA